MQPEARITRKIRLALMGRGFFVFKIHGSEMMMAGLPDLIACRQGHFYGIEVKTPRGRVSERQRYVHKQIKASGGTVIVARSVEEALEQLEKGPQDRS